MCSSTTPAEPRSEPPPPAPTGDPGRDAVVVDGRQHAFRRPARGRRHLAGRPAGDDPRADRSVGRGQDHDDPAADGRPDADQRAGHRPRRGAAPLPTPDPRADRLHAAVVHALPGPDRPRERRLRRRRCSGCSSGRDGGGPARSSSSSTCGMSASRRAGRLSGGMQRRLELACALVHDPALLFLDEPTAGIDPLLRGRVWEELHRLRDAGRTMLVTTQYVNEAESCDHGRADRRRAAARPRDAGRPAPRGGRRRRRRRRDG